MSTKFKNVPFGTEVPEITKSDAGNNIIALKDFTVDFTGATVCGLTTYEGPTWEKDDAGGWYSYDWFRFCAGFSADCASFNGQATFGGETWFTSTVYFCGTVCGLPGPEWTTCGTSAFTETSNPEFRGGLTVLDSFSVKASCGSLTYLDVDSSCGYMFTESPLICFHGQTEGTGGFDYDHNSVVLQATYIKLKGVGLDGGTYIVFNHGGRIGSSESYIGLDGRFDFTCATILGGQIVLDTSCGGVHLKAGDSDLLLNADNIQKIKDAAGIS